MVAADLIDKPFPRSTLAEEPKSGSESAKRKDATKETAGTTMAESLSHKDSVDSMIFIALILHRIIFNSSFFLFLTLCAIHLVVYLHK